MFCYLVLMIVYLFGCFGEGNGFLDGLLCGVVCLNWRLIEDVEFKIVCYELIGFVWYYCVCLVVIVWKLFSFLCLGRIFVVFIFKLYFF